MDKNTYYCLDWEDPSEYPDFAAWIQKGKDGKHFKCKVCKTTSLKLSNMGTEALRSHIKGDKKNKDDANKKSKHQRNMEAFNKNRRICFGPVNVASTSSTQSLPVAAADHSIVITAPNKSPVVQSTIRTKGKEVQHAEILLSMKSVVSHIPQRSLDDFGDLATGMFTDSEIAKLIEIGRTKLGYNINYGLAPYYEDKLYECLVPKEDISVPPKFVACFDEAYNSVTHNKQFDVHVIYFDESTRRVVRKYLTSQFIGHGDAKALLSHFEKVLEKVDIRNLVQISMDGPHVNWKMLEMAIEERKKDPLCPELLIIGSCGLHVLHGAYETGQNATEWNLGKSCLKPSFSIFNKSPARRADYLISNGLHEEYHEKSSSCIFPMKYCGHRWLENGKAIKRIIEIYPNIKTYFKFLKEVKKDKILDKDDRFTKLQKHLSSPLFKAILEFSACIITDIEPDLTIFQSERPLAIYLHERMHTLMLNIMQRFVKSEVLETNSSTRSMMKIDLKDESNLKPATSVNVGFGAKKALKSLGTTHALEVRNFYKNARNLLVSLTEKLRERCPLKYGLCIALSSLSPGQMSAARTSTLVKNFDKLLEILVTKAWVSSVSADRAQSQYRKMIEDKAFLKKCSEFNMFESRLDDFFMEALDESSLDLIAVVKLCLILSHGNARVESGFSINEQILQENMKERTIIAQRHVYEGIMAEGGIYKVDINSSMMSYVKKSHSVYMLELEKNKKRQTEVERKRAARKRLNVDIKNLQEKKKVALSDASNTVSTVDAKIHALEEDLRKIS